MVLDCLARNMAMNPTCIYIFFTKKLLWVSRKLYELKKIWELKNRKKNERVCDQLCLINLILNVLDIRFTIGKSHNSYPQQNSNEKEKKKRLSILSSSGPKKEKYFVIISHSHRSTEGDDGTVQTVLLLLNPDAG